MAKKRSRSSWEQSVTAALRRSPTGTLSLRELYDVVKQLREERGESISATFQATIRRTCQFSKWIVQDRPGCGFWRLARADETLDREDLERQLGALALLILNEEPQQRATLQRLLERIGETYANVKNPRPLPSKGAIRRACRRSTSIVEVEPGSDVWALRPVA
jgi:hypothetical protein